MKPFSPSYNGATTISEASFVPSRCRIRHVVWHCLIVLSEAIDPRVRSCLVSFCLSSTRLRSFRLYCFPFSVRKRNHPPPHTQANKQTHTNKTTIRQNYWIDGTRTLSVICIRYFFQRIVNWLHLITHTHTHAVFLFLSVSFCFFLCLSFSHTFESQVIHTYN